MSSSFLNPCIDLLYNWHGYGHWSEILFGTIPTSAYDPEVKVSLRNFMLKV